MPTLFIPPTTRGFVDQNTGGIHLSRVLVPVDQSLPAGALGIIRGFIRTMNKDASIELMHVGETRPQIIEDRTVVPVALRTGDPAATILASAEQVDLIAMTTHSRPGVAGFALGSVASATVRHARVPILLVHPAPAHS